MGRNKKQSYSGGRQKNNANLYRKTSAISQIVGVLYTEKMPVDWKEFLARCPDLFNVCGVVSPRHAPDDHDKKEHRHIIIRSITRKALIYNDVDFILHYLNGDYLIPLCIYGSVQGLRNMCRYLIHSTDASATKEQFCLTNPEYIPDEDIPDNGIINGRTWVFHNDYGLYIFGQFDYWHYVQYTDVEIRERNRIATEKEETEYTNKGFILSEWLDSPECKDKSFLGLVRWARDNGFFKTLKKDWGFYKALCSEYRFNTNNANSEIYGEKYLINTLPLFRRVIQNYNSFVSETIIIFIYDLCKEQIQEGITDFKARQLFTKVYNCQTSCIRRQYTEQYNTFITLLDKGDILYELNTD